MQVATHRPGNRREVVRSLLRAWSDVTGRAPSWGGRSFCEPLEGRTLLSVAIASGQTITASVGAVGEADTYTISGVAGGTLMATVGETVAGSSLSPQVELHAPGGSLLTFSNGAAGATVTSHNLPSTGTYTVIVRDANNTHTGGYAVTAVSIGAGITQNSGGDAGAATSALTRTAAISVGDIDAFTLNGVAGGTLMATVGETVAGSPLSPQVELYSPAGVLLTFSNSGSGTTVTSHNLPTTGTYTVVVRDAFGSGTGGYDLTPVSIGAGISQDSGGDAGPVGSAVTKTAAIGIGDIDVFTLNGVAGGTFMATVGETVAGSPLSPQIELYTPGGVLLTFSNSGTGTTITSHNLPTTGTYTLVVRDAFGTGTGGYAVTPVSIGAGISQDPGGDAGATTSALTRTAAIGIGDIDVFTLNGVAGGTFLATVGETVAGSPLSPQIELYTPGGVLLTFSNSGTGTTITSHNLPTTGTYLVVVRDAFGTGTGGYAVTPVSIGAGITQDPGGDAGPIGSAVTKTAAIGVGDVDVFTLSGVAGGTFLATVGETVAGSPLSPQIELYSPAGVLLTFSNSGTGTTITSHNLPTTGTYTLVVRDAFGTGTGGYAVTPVSIGGGISQDSGGDGGFIASGVQRNAAITVGDVDVDPFYAVTGDKLVISVAESVAGSPLTPQVELYSPTGQLITFSNSASATTITDNSAATTGLYTIVVRDASGSGTGGYKLNLTETPSAIKPTITVAATDALAVENGPDTGQFTITRTNLRALPVTVTYVMSGTAVNGVDYTMLTGTAVIPANSASVTITLNALNDVKEVNSETATLTLETGSAYTLGTPTSATVTIDDEATAAGTVFNDLNGNTTRDSGEPGLAGWTVFIDTNGDGKLDNGERSVLTDSSGNFLFNGLAPATYVLRVVPQSGWSQTLPTSNGALSFTVTIGGSKTGLLFGEKKIA